MPKMKRREDPARIFHLCVTNKDPDLIDSCETILKESDRSEWQENMFYVVLQYHLYRDQPDLAYELIDGFYEQFHLVRPRLLHAWIDYCAKKSCFQRLECLVNSKFFSQVELSEESYIKAMQLAIKHSQPPSIQAVFWTVFNRLSLVVQFITKIELLQEMFLELGLSCQPVTLSSGKCQCGIKAVYRDNKEIDLAKFSQLVKIKTDRLPKGHTIVVDGANVGFYDLPTRVKNSKQNLDKVKKDCDGKINWSNIIKMDRFLKSCGHSPLFVFNVRHKERNQTRVSSFYSPSNVNDDLYFVYLAMFFKIPLVSNDDLSDMCLAVDPDIDYWVRRNRVCYRFEEKGKIGYYYKDHHRNLYRCEAISYSIAIQPHGDGSGGSGGSDGSDGEGYLVPSLSNQEVVWYCFGQT